MSEPDRLNNIWYQSFNQLEIAPALVGASRESCRAYIGYFLKHWSHRKQAFDARGTRAIGRHVPSVAGTRGSRTHRAAPSAAPLVLKTRGPTGTRPLPSRW